MSGSPDRSVEWMQRAGTAIVLIAVAGCGSQGREGPRLQALDPAATVYKEVYPGCGHEPALLMVRTAEEWTAALDGPLASCGRLREPVSAAGVDLPREMLLVAAQGGSSGGGRSIRIASTERRTDSLHVTVIVREPPPGCPVPAAPSAPIHVVRHPPERIVVFRKLYERECGPG